MAALTPTARQAGLAFQIADDILNVEDARRLGKTTRSDAAPEDHLSHAWWAGGLKRKTHLVRQAVTS